MDKIVEAKHYNEGYLTQKIWGCLADILEYSRYEMLLNLNDNKTAIFLTEHEFNKFNDEVKKQINNKINIKELANFKKIISEVKKQIRRIENE